MPTARSIPTRVASKIVSTNVLMIPTSLTITASASSA
jgi:hypothetical protein